MERIEVRANPNCKNCLGSGRATPMHVLCGRPVCSCVTEQLRIIVTDNQDYSIPAKERYSPGEPEYIVVEKL